MPTRSTSTQKRSTSPAADVAGSAVESHDRSNLSQGQSMIWTGQQLFPDSPQYNMAFLFSIEGCLDPVRFEDAFRRLVAECDTLRTIFESNNSVPRQRVMDEPPAGMEFIDLSHDVDARSTVFKTVTERVQRLFDLRKCLFDCVLFKCGSNNFSWYLNQHHLITDASSLRLLYLQMQELYADVDAVSGDSSGTFLEYVAFEQTNRSSTAFQQSKKYWADRNATAGESPTSFYGKQNTGQQPRAERIQCKLGAERSMKLREISQTEGIKSLFADLSLFNVVATVLFAYLFRISGRKTLSITTPTHNRQSPRFRNTIGACLEFYPLTASTRTDASFRDSYLEVAENSLTMLRHISPGASEATATANSEVLLNYIKGSYPDFQGFTTHAEWIHSGYIDPNHAMRIQVSDFDDSGTIDIAFDLNCDVFDNELRKTVCEQFLTVVDAFIENQNQPIESVELMSDADCQKHLVDLNATAEKSLSQQTILQMIQASVTAYPNDTAVVCGDTRLTYQALEKQSNTVASVLRQHGAVRNARVAVCMPRSVDTLIAILATLKAGAAYVPVDPYFPVERIADVLEDSRATVVLTQSAFASRLATSATVLCVDEVLQKPSINSEDTPVHHAAGQSDPAYMIYTSGSTGKPKGVVVSHGALANYIGWARNLYCGRQRLAFPLFSPLTFDLTVTSVFVPLVAGGQIVVYPEQSENADLSVVNVIDDNQVDIIKLTPSHLALLQGRDFADSRISQMILGGEELRCDLAESISTRFGGRIRIHNEYGPTEATVGCILHTYDPANDRDSSVPIGRPIANMQAYVLNSHLKAVPRGVTGELYVAGDGLANGYWNRPDLTAERFIENPYRPDTLMYRTGDLARINEAGIFECLGRDDDQVKINGARIELGEIEAAMTTLPEINACVITADDRTTKDEQEELHHCTRCGLPSNYPGVEFNDQQVCNTCTTFDTYKGRAEKYFRSMDDLQNIFTESRKTNTSEYDCLALLSGGKDSTYTLCRLVDMGLKVLTFTLDNGYISEEAKANIRGVVKKLNVEHIFGSTPAMNEIFVDSLQRHSNVCHGCFKTVYTLSLKLAKEKKIPMIVTGLSRGQLFETRLPEEVFTDTEYDVDRIDQTILDARKAYHRIEDAVSRNLDVGMFSDDRIFEEIQFIDFYRYCPVELDEMYAYLDERVSWIRPSDTGRSTNCLINDVGIFVHKREKGFHNYALPYAWDVRIGHKTRDAALDELDDEIDEGNALRILGEVGYNQFDSAPPASRRKRLIAYYTAEREIPSTDLKARLEKRLPSIMVPSIFKRLEEIPLTANGKVNRKALPQPGETRKALNEDYIAPTSQQEKDLARIWEDVLQVERVGLHDNFFDLGGDSIAAIQVIARANRVGLNLTPINLFNTLTVKRLAAVIGTTPAIKLPQQPVTGPVTLSPVQEWFFEQEHEDVNHWNHLVRLSVPKDVNQAVLEESINSIIRHHDALRLKFVNEGEAWSATLDDAVEATKLTVHRLESLAPDQIDDRIHEIEATLQRQLNIAQGRLLAATLFRFDDRRAILTLAIHHLVVDAVSWSVILEDLATAYQQQTNGEAINLPNKTTSFQAWSNLLHEDSQSTVRREELSFWEKSLKTPVSSLPVDQDLNAKNTQKSASTISVQPGTEQTSTLLTNIPKNSRISVHEMLSAALAITLQKWTKNHQIRFDLEGHGREPIASDMDTSRTVGWFTSIYPAAFTLSENADLSTTLACVKDHLRSIPNRGIGYGILRYLSPDVVVRQTLAASTADVLFNYLGRTGTNKSEDSQFRQLRPLELSRSDLTIRPYLLEVNAMVTDDVLTIDWTYCNDIHSKRTIQSVADSYIASLKTLITHCVSSGQAESSASDFPLAKLDEQKLKKLSRLLQKTKSHGGSNHES